MLNFNQLCWHINTLKWALTSSLNAKKHSFISEKKKNNTIFLYKIFSNISTLRGCDDVWIWALMAYLPSIDCTAGGWISSYLVSDIKRRDSRFCRKKHNIRIKKKLKVNYLATDHKMFARMFSYFWKDHTQYCIMAVLSTKNLI